MNMEHGVKNLPAEAACGQVLKRVFCLTEIPGSVFEFPTHPESVFVNSLFLEVISKFFVSRAFGRQAQSRQEANLPDCFAQAGPQRAILRLKNFASLREKLHSTTFEIRSSSLLKKEAPQKCRAGSEYIKNKHQSIVVGHT